ncbi:MAG: GNAT family N-acetyltransferase [Dehalococcoidia bacterium]|nr:GNAT family N-acetyltransferase [Dehalococcoidia bacterium]
MSIEMGNLIRLSRADVQSASRMLARAFVDYPLLVHAVADPARREREAAFFAQFDLYYGIRYGEVYATSPRMEGVAVWVPSERLPMTTCRLLGAVPWRVIAAFGRGVGRRLVGPSRHVDARHEVLAPFPHWFLSLLGVAPESQRHGFAGALLRPMLASFDARGLPCYLETMEGRNVARYEHFGFRVLEESSVPGTSLTSWAMLRGNPPQTR